MVAAPSVLEVRPVGVDSFDEIYPLLLLFGNRKMSRNDWQRMLFSYQWWDGNERGFALYCDGVPVGFIGTIFSRRRIRGRDQIVCNASSWIVREEHRSASILLLKALLALPDCTLVNLTPTSRTYDIFKKLGFKPLERELFLLPPVVNPIPLVDGSITSDPQSFLDELTQDERLVFTGLAGTSGVAHILLRRGGQRCYIVATVGRFKRLPVAELHYVGDTQFFWKNRALAHLALFQKFGAIALRIDARFSSGNVKPFALRRRAERLYRPADPQTPPEAIDGLFSELMVLKI